MKILLIIALLLFILFIWSCCKTAGRADRIIEGMQDKDGDN